MAGPHLTNCGPRPSFIQAVSTPRQDPYWAQMVFLSRTQHGCKVSAGTFLRTSRHFGGRREADSGVVVDDSTWTMAVCHVLGVACLLVECT